MAAGGEDRLTNAHIALLAASISTRDLESVALVYLGIGIEIIKSLRDQQGKFRGSKPRHFSKVGQ